MTDVPGSLQPRTGSGKFRWRIAWSRNGAANLRLFRIFGDEPKGNQQIGAVSSIAGHPLWFRDMVLSPPCRFLVPVELVFASETLIHAPIVRGMARSAILCSKRGVKESCFKQVKFGVPVGLAFDEFQSIDLAFDLAITPRKLYRGFHGR
jgi:hypothetical protein